jgi:hypothetical protein
MVAATTRTRLTRLIKRTTLRPMKTTPAGRFDAFGGSRSEVLMVRPGREGEKRKGAGASACEMSRGSKKARRRVVLQKREAERRKGMGSWLQDDERGKSHVAHSLSCRLFQGVERPAREHKGSSLLQLRRRIVSDGRGGRTKG